MDDITRVLFTKYVGVLMDGAVTVAVTFDEGDPSPFIDMSELGDPFASWDLLTGSYSDW